MEPTCHTRDSRTVIQNAPSRRSRPVERRGGHDRQFLTRVRRRSLYYRSLGGTAVLSKIGGVRRRVSAGQVALTFDDGPHPGSTDRLLDVLAEANVLATFFVVGRNAHAYPQLVKRMWEGGHGVGSHSLDHLHPRELTTAEAMKQYVAGRHAVEDVLGAEVKAFRPPHGYLDLATARELRRETLEPWLWTVDPQDWRPGITSGAVAKPVELCTSGDVVLLHDWIEEAEAPTSLDRTATIQAMPAIVRAVQSQGLCLSPLPGSVRA
jgi:peptidoglycan/xylan/chitin deacetylase (PgdA/CDA1 family)